MLFGHARVEAMYSFENAFERFFPGVESRTKFLVLTFGKETVDTQSFRAAFMLRDESFLALPDVAREARSVRIASAFILK